MMPRNTLSKASIADAPKADPQKRDRLILLALFVLVGLGLTGLVAATGWHETWHQFLRLSWLQLALLLVLSLVNYLLRGLRWHLFTRSLGLNTGLVQDMRHFLAGFAMTITPGRVGELVRMRWLRRETGKTVDQTAPLALVDRAADLAAIALILGLSLPLSASGITGAVPVTVLALLVACLVTRPRILSACVDLAYRTFGRFPRGFARVRRSARSLGAFSSGPAMISALGLGVAGWLAEGFAFYLLLQWLGGDVSLWTAIAIFVFATLAGGLTGAPGGLGGAEAAMVALLSLEGVPLEVSLPATLIIRATTLWFAIAIGMALFPLAERLSLKD